MLSSVSKYAKDRERAFQSVRRQMCEETLKKRQAAIQETEDEERAAFLQAEVEKRQAIQGIAALRSAMRVYAITSDDADFAGQAQVRRLWVGG